MNCAQLFYHDLAKDPEWESALSFHFYWCFEPKEKAHLKRGCLYHDGDNTSAVLEPSGAQLAGEPSKEVGHEHSFGRLHIILPVVAAVSERIPVPPANSRALMVGTSVELQHACLATPDPRDCMLSRSKPFE